MERMPKPRTEEETRATIRKYQLNFPCWDDNVRQPTCPDIRCSNAFRCMTSMLTLIEVKLLEDDGISEEVIRQRLFSDEKNKSRDQSVEKLNLDMTKPYEGAKPENNENN
ncbi:MAG: hypothetical protein G01um10147_429 [Microgenomates group bacterium Gr01-1014_7]|nr:MAG: hypothetical protein G01um10147_429 [Microgenomates group bacterium Gr01-1014_7]